MKDKRVRDKFYNTSDQELRFTKEDRNQVFEQIHKLEKNNPQKKSLSFFFKKTRSTYSFFISGQLVCVFVYSIESSWKTVLTKATKVLQANGNASGSVVQENESFNHFIHGER